MSTGWIITALAGLGIGAWFAVLFRDVRRRRARQAPPAHSDTRPSPAYDRVAYMQNGGKASPACESDMA